MDESVRKRCRARFLTRENASQEGIATAVLRRPSGGGENGSGSGNPGQQEKLIAGRRRECYTAEKRVTIRCSDPIRKRK